MRATTRCSTGAFPSVPPLSSRAGRCWKALSDSGCARSQNVTLLEGYDIADLMSTAGDNRVTGALIRAHNGVAEQELAADLIIDATGRGSERRRSWRRSAMAGPPRDSVQVR